MQIQIQHLLKLNFINVSLGFATALYSNTTLVKVKFNLGLIQQTLSVIQIQHLLKLNYSTETKMKSSRLIQIQHLLKLNEDY